MLIFPKATWLILLLQNWCLEWKWGWRWRWWMITSELGVNVWNMYLLYWELYNIEVEIGLGAMVRGSLKIFSFIYCIYYFADVETKSLCAIKNILIYYATYVRLQLGASMVKCTTLDPCSGLSGSDPKLYTNFEFHEIEILKHFEKNMNLQSQAI